LKTVPNSDQPSAAWLIEGGTLLTLLAAATYFIRGLLLLLAMDRYRGYRPQRRRRFFRHAVIVACLAIAIVGLTAGWPYRVGADWVAHEIFDQNSGIYRGPGSPAPTAYATPLIPLSADQEVVALEAAARKMPTAEERLTAVNLLIRNHPDAVAGVLNRIAPAEVEPAVCVAELHVLAMTRDSGAANTFEHLLADPRPEVRAAAADGMGIGFASRFQLEGGTERNLHFASVPHELQTVPAIRIDGLLAMKNKVRPPTDAQRAALMKTMLSGETSLEREAAARALLPFPPSGYKLRLAEWGVWAGQAGRMAMVKSLLDEIPPFVHQTRNPASQFADRIETVPYIVKKPIIHLTVNQPMAVDLSVIINSGRPWFAYPKPDDFSISTYGFVEGLRGIGPGSEDEPELLHEVNPENNLSDIREGYPWLSPHHRVVESSGNRLGGGQIHSLGLHWQSVIASPKKLPWMSPPACGPDAKYDWWNQLRQVPSAWVSSRGEADRFFYYDGPSFAPTPVSALYKDGALAVRISADLLHLSNPAGFDGVEQHHRVRGYEQRDGLFITVVHGQPTAKRVPIGPADATVQLQPLPDHTGPAAIAMFRQMLIDAGLTDAEAGGLIVSWKHHFFETDGKRFLLLMSASDYDTLCPIQVQPVPTEMTRVGIVLTEF
jgi:hypothetical protein